jgi:peptidoglycan/xylan/chitin deacetylase (PgdA/CDA1 family)
MKAILTFHSIDSSQSVLSFHPDNFLRLIQSLTDMGMPICSLDTLLQDNVSRGIALTFDDGMLSVFSHALPIIKDFNIPAHLFLTTGTIGGKNNWPGLPEGAPKFVMMNWNQIEDCQAGGITIEAHTQTHPDLNQLNTQELEDECEGCDHIIEQRLGKKPVFFAYPYGFHNEKNRKFMKSRYRASVTTFLRPLYKKEEDSSALPRLDSYFLQPHWIQNKLENPTGHIYLLSRSLIRTLRGHQ